MVKRLLQTYLQRDSGFYPVVSLTGPRQSGKTILAKTVFSNYDYVSLEETEQRVFAKKDRLGFLARFKKPVILDEIQRAPDLFSYIQSAVDLDDTPDRFILTGSHTFLLIESISQTLAGRCGVLHLMPFSRAELEGYQQKEPFAPDVLFSNRNTHLDLW